MAVASVAELFDTQMPARLQAKPDLAAKINAIYKFVVNGDGGGTWLVDLKQPGGVVSKADGEANCTVTINAQDLVDVVNGKTNAQMAFMSGKIKVAGDMGLAMKLQSILG
ncbi:MAG: SCP2 sterol-binding domain-containing protein [Clostridia bacterium]|nr:SCP2 sterol-binding domain-containing protein [Deltaproteobacteria bacterium]